jgi:hypothetical protein
MSELKYTSHPRLVPGVQHDLVPLADEQLRVHQAEPVADPVIKMRDMELFVRLIRTRAIRVPLLHVAGR